MDFLNWFLRNFPVAWSWIFAANEQSPPGLPITVQDWGRARLPAEKSTNECGSQLG